jgi:F420-dependent oxidoreductase-like protein
MRFAVKTRPEHQTWKELRDLWVEADQVELFESVWNWDHFYPLTGDTHGSNFEGWSMLAAMAEATSRIRIGCQVTGMIYRHPALLANIAATVDVISDGRLELGVGAGWNQQETDAYGIDLPPLRERFDRFDEGVEAMIKLLSERTTTFEGKYVKLTDAYCEPKPVQQPHPPITIGGRGKKRTLKTTARFAQQWNAIAADTDDWLDLKQVLVSHCEDIGRDPAEITCSVNVRMNSDDDLDAVVETSSAYAEAGADLAVVGLPLHANPDVIGQLADRLAPLAQGG